MNARLTRRVAVIGAAAFLGGCAQVSTGDLVSQSDSRTDRAWLQTVQAPTPLATALKNVEGATMLSGVASFDINCPSMSYSHVGALSRACRATTDGKGLLAGRATDRLKAEAHDFTLRDSSEEDSSVAENDDVPNLANFEQTGKASWYGRGFHGRMTANGERFDMYALTAAHRSLPMSSYVRVTNESNQKSIIVKINDRGPFHGSRIIDLSYGAARALNLRGVQRVSIHGLSREEAQVAMRENEARSSTLASR
ncbi:septal ring lytic transglycosylase RlpA family protein [Chitinasiproducens palmae]|uniref:Endolytic peptidoglycan transglycosylase RlpA n=1 Tax=Chitinasiproducens palmae TaxID=1770053 RepID=A0A1H2PPH4_9BURK|nr:septal ring lytic transglycosylase RlpA family protein [Chitinasiproducens palmae]SDV48619.1 rare lipoprotein A [Chitinasiproducens palmae]